MPSNAVAAVIGGGFREADSGQHLSGRRVDFYPQRIAGCHVRRMLVATVAARTGRQPDDQVNFSKELKIVAGAHRARFHEILMRVLCETSSHEHIEHIVNVQFCDGYRHVQMLGQRPCGDNVPKAFECPTFAAWTLRLGRLCALFFRVD